MKIEDRRGQTPLTIEAKELPVGTVFYATLNGAHRLLLKAYKVYIDLDNPQATWNELHNIHAEVVAAKVVIE